MDGHGAGAYGVIDFDETELTYEAYMLKWPKDSSTVDISEGVFVMLDHHLKG